MLYLSQLSQSPLSQKTHVVLLALRTLLISVVEGSWSTSGLPPISHTPDTVFTVAPWTPPPTKTHQLQPNTTSPSIQSVPSSLGNCHIGLVFSLLGVFIGVLLGAILVVYRLAKSSPTIQATYSSSNPSHLNRDLPTIQYSDTGAWAGTSTDRLGEDTQLPGPHLSGTELLFATPKEPVYRDSTLSQLEDDNQLLQTHIAHQNARILDMETQAAESRSRTAQLESRLMDSDIQASEAQSMIRQLNFDLDTSKTRSVAQASETQTRDTQIVLLQAQKASLETRIAEADDYRVRVDKCLGGWRAYGLQLLKDHTKLDAEHATLIRNWNIVVTDHERLTDKIRRMEVEFNPPIYAQALNEGAVDEWSAAIVAGL
ncbi:hypothetical protein DXG01_011988 [Tephrocybe rancida]|nr:hypothetical protein DXG01_011988 [Tephrocybe rancida]